MRLGRLVTGHYMAGYVCLCWCWFLVALSSQQALKLPYTHTPASWYTTLFTEDGGKKKKNCSSGQRRRFSSFFLFHNTNLLVLIIPLLLFLSFFPYALANGCPFVSMENKQQYWACVNLSVVLNEQEEKQRRKTLRLHIFCFVSSFGSVFVLQTW